MPSTAQRLHKIGDSWRAIHAEPPGQFIRGPDAGGHTWISLKALDQVLRACVQFHPGIHQIGQRL